MTDTYTYIHIHIHTCIFSQVTNTYIHIHMHICIFSQLTHTYMHRHALTHLGKTHSFSLSPKFLSHPYTNISYAYTHTYTYTYTHVYSHKSQIRTCIDMHICMFSQLTHTYMHRHALTHSWGNPLFQSVAKIVITPHTRICLKYIYIYIYIHMYILITHAYTHTYIHRRVHLHILGNTRSFSLSPKLLSHPYTNMFFFLE